MLTKETTAYTNRFTIGGLASRQVRAIADNVLLRLKHSQVCPVGLKRRGVDQWIVLDYRETVVCVPARAAKQYDLMVGGR